MNRINEMLLDLEMYVDKLLLILDNEEETAEEYIGKMISLKDILETLEEALPTQILSEYSEFIKSFAYFCTKCKDTNFLYENVGILYTSLELLKECLDEMGKKCSDRIKTCPCCHAQVIYEPLSDYYDIMKQRYGITKKSVNETLNRDEYGCPNCGSSDRDRLIISYLMSIHLKEASEETKILQIAPAQSIHRWIEQECPQLTYHTTDLLMEGVTFHSDIQDLKEVEDEYYDIIICSHILEHVENDLLAMESMKRVIKKDGQIVFLVPLDLLRKEIDEEWGCSDEENWKRFGQNDHCRAYSKKGLLERLKKYFFVTQLGKEYFGEQVFWDCGLSDTSTLYILTKKEDMNLDKRYDYTVNDKLCKNGPLVSVVMSAYNHEKFVGSAIESVVNQSYSNIEFIVGDDGSSDNTAIIMKQYSQYFAKEIYYEQNAGGRTRQLRQFAHGKYIAIMNSDDIWEKDKLALEVQYLEEHPECGACLTWCMYTNEDLDVIWDDRIFIQKNRSKYEWMKFFWKNGNVLCNPSAVIRSEYYDTKLFFGSANRQVPDLFKWIWIIQETEIHIIPSVLTYMRRYNIGKVENTSAPNEKNLVRHLVECGISWLNVIKYMDKEFFINTFSDSFVFENANSDSEIMCEKYFLLLNSPNQFIQYSALCYLNEFYSEMKETLENKYGYNRKNIWEDELGKGFGHLFIH